MSALASKPAFKLLVVLAVTFAFNRALQSFNVPMPRWLAWVAIGSCVLIGLRLTVNPTGTPDMRPAFSRALGIAFLLIAGLGAYYLIFKA